MHFRQHVLHDAVDITSIARQARPRLHSWKQVGRRLTLPSWIQPLERGEVHAGVGHWLEGGSRVQAVLGVRNAKHAARGSGVDVQQEAVAVVVHVGCAAPAAVGVRAQIQHDEAPRTAVVGDVDLGVAVRRPELGVHSHDIDVVDEVLRDLADVERAGASVVPAHDVVAGERGAVCRT